MNNNSSPSWLTRLEELLLESRTHMLAPAEQIELNTLLRTHAEAPSHAARFLLDDAALAEGLRDAQVEALFRDEPRSVMSHKTSTFSSPRTAWIQWQSLTAAAAGLMIGLFSASLAWAITVPRFVTSASRLFALVDGSFEKQSGRVAQGFPSVPGEWSGDEAKIVEDRGAGTKDGRRSLSFLKAGGDASVPNSPAEACDVYQLVDLRPLQTGTAHDAQLELSAEFFDARTLEGAPLVFACHIYLFAGSAESLHSMWPDAARDALGIGAGYAPSHGGADAGVWRRVTARCVLPPQADFAVIKLSAARGDRRSGPEPLLGMQFVDDVQLTLKTQPELPVRIVQR